MSRREEREAPLAEDRDQNETIEIALVVGHDHQWPFGRDPLGRHDLEPEGAPEERSTANAVAV